MSYYLDRFDVSLIDSNSQINGWDKLILLQDEYDSTMDVIEKLYVKVIRLIVA